MGRHCEFQFLHFKEKPIVTAHAPARFHCLHSRNFVIESVLLLVMSLQQHKYTGKKMQRSEAFRPGNNARWNKRKGPSVAKSNGPFPKHDEKESFGEAHFSVRLGVQAGEPQVKIPRL